MDVLLSTFSSTDTALQQFAEAKICEVYQEVAHMASKMPAAARAFEQTALIQYMLDVRNEAQHRYSEAFAICGVEYPDLLWTREVNPKIEVDPAFQYCDVLGLIPEEVGRGEFKGEPKRNARTHSLSLAATVGLFAAGVVLKFASALAGGRQTTALAGALSTVGWVLIVIGLTYSIYVAVRRSGSTHTTNVPGKGMDVQEGENRTNQNLTAIMRQQKVYNLNVTLRWLEDVQRLATVAFQKYVAQK